MKRNKGFSLVELLIAIAILAIIMVMISSFMSSTLNSYTKNRREMQVQDEAQRIFYQISDMIMQATYIRVTSVDGTAYEYDEADKSFKSVTPTVALKKNFVPDDYSNYQLNGNSSYAQRKVIVDFDTYELVDENNKVYPDAGPETPAIDASNLVDKEDKTGSVEIQSFRALNQAGKSYYIVPEYIYIEYSNTYTGVTTGTVGGEEQVIGTTIGKACVMLKYDSTNRTLYMLRHEPATSGEVPGTVGFYEMKGKTFSSYISDKIKSLYLSARSDDNVIDLAMVIEDERSEGFLYRLKETVNIRNNNVLTVKPQLLRRKVASGSGGSGGSSGGTGGAGESGGGTGGSGGGSEGSGS